MLCRSDKADIHPKSWGHEEWIVNNEEYCGKRLVFEKAGGRTSLHFHVKKRETMWVLKGKFRIHLVDHWDGKEHAEDLLPGDSIEISRMQVHRIEALDDGSEMIEFSTQHEDFDSRRVAR